MVVFLQLRYHTTAGLGNEKLTLTLLGIQHTSVEATGHPWEACSPSPPPGTLCSQSPHMSSGGSPAFPGDPLWCCQYEYSHVKCMAFLRKYKIPGYQSEVMDSDLHELLQTFCGRQETLVFYKGPPLKGRQKSCVSVTASVREATTCLFITGPKINTFAAHKRGQNKAVVVNATLNTLRCLKCH